MKFGKNTDHNHTHKLRTKYGSQVNN